MPLLRDFVPALKFGAKVHPADLLAAAGLGYTTGNVYYVMASSASEYADFERQYNVTYEDGTNAVQNDLDTAIGQCTANKGDVIVLTPGHSETVTAAGGIDADIAGITVLGIGNGDVRPTIDFTTAVGADVDIDAADITFANILFTGGVDALTGPIDVNSDDFTLLNCEYRDVTGQATDVIVATGDRLTIDGYKHDGAAAAGGASAIQLTGTDRTTIKNFWIDGNFSAACIESVTTANTELTITAGYARTRNAADIIIALQATDTGNIGPDLFFRLQDDAANITECITINNDCQLFDPIMVCNADAERGVQYNGTASTYA